MAGWAKGAGLFADSRVVMSLSSRPGLVRWVAVVVALVALTAFSLGPSARWGSPVVLFWVVSIGAGLCAVAAALVVVLGVRGEVAEVALAGAALWAASILPFVHGVTAPGVLYGDNAAVILGAFLALPVALVSGFPLIAPQWVVSRRAARHWRAWTWASIGVSTVLAIVLLALPRQFPAPSLGSRLSVGVGAACLVAFVAMSWRQLTLYWVSRRRSALVTSMAYLLLGSTALVWWQTKSFTAGWWLVHAMDISAVFLGCFGALRSRQLPRDVTAILAPLLSRDPLVALEFGMAPVVHRFVADLEAKDPITRDHVVRTAEAALRVGHELGAPYALLRFLGLAALLHDVGKLDVPDVILHKAGRLDAQEFAVMRRHTETGGRHLSAVALLAPAAGFVRAHHERVDGGGYPDGLVGEAIPFEARIISVCDAYDAMANTRQYRVGMGAARAEAILREHAGSQWDASVVAVAVRVLRDIDGERPALDHVGRGPLVEDDMVDGCVCADALPIVRSV